MACTAAADAAAMLSAEAISSEEVARKCSEARDAHRSAIKTLFLQYVNSSDPAGKEDKEEAGEEGSACPLGAQQAQRRGTAADIAATLRVVLIGDATHPMSPFKGLYYYN